jgi:hypothetical protein
MSLYTINPGHLNSVWSIVAPMLQRALDLDPSFMTIDQMQLLIRQGKLILLVHKNEAEEITGAATVEFIDTPLNRIAHVSCMGGAGIVRDHVFKEAQDWMRAQGATIAQCWAKGTLVQMYEKMGMKNTHQVMRVPL